QIEERSNGAASALAGSKLQHLAEQDKNGDDGGCFEIDSDLSVIVAELRRKDVWRQQGDEAVGPGDAGAQSDQREHVEIARDQRGPAALEEWPARPEHHRRCKNKLEPGVDVRGYDCGHIEQVTSH